MSVDRENTCYAKLLSADTAHIQSIIDVERGELQQLLDEDEETVGLMVSLSVLTHCSYQRFLVRCFILVLVFV